jgi:hypothetical protein
MSLALVLWTIDKLADREQKRRRASVLVHEAAFFAPDPTTGTVKWSEPHYFVKVTNLSETRVIEITHVWFDGRPQVHLLIPERPLPARLPPDKTWEGWVRVADVAHIPDVERSARVRLSNTKVVRSRANKDVPPVGFVAGPGQ